MEILLVLVLVGLGAAFYWNKKSKDSKSSSTTAPYKVETPAQDTAAPAWHTAPPEGTQPTAFPNPLDVNNDGKVNLEDVKEVVKKTRARVKKAADVDGDGKVTKKDAKVAAKKVKAKAAKKTAKSK